MIYIINDVWLQSSWNITNNIKVIVVYFDKIRSDLTAERAGGRLYSYTERL